MTQQNGKILIVDDDPLSFETLLLHLSDYETFVAVNGVEALALADAVDPDVILLDILMPEMDGYEVIRQLAENPKLCDIPVLFITCMTETECEVKGLMLGAHDYLTKPFNPHVVRLRVKNHIDFKHKNDLVKQQRDLLSLKNRELEMTVARLKKLEGIITVCMYCKQVRNKSDAWEQFEKYIADNSEVKFSHGICPDCMEKHRDSFSFNR